MKTSSKMKLAAKEGDQSHFRLSFNSSRKIFRGTSKNYRNFYLQRQLRFEKNDSSIKGIPLDNDLIAC